MHWKTLNGYDSCLVSSKDMFSILKIVLVAFIWQETMGLFYNLSTYVVFIPLDLMLYAWRHDNSVELEYVMDNPRRSESKIKDQPQCDLIWTGLSINWNPSKPFSHLSMTELDAVDHVMFSVTPSIRHFFLSHEQYLAQHIANNCLFSIFVINYLVS